MECLVGAADHSGLMLAARITLLHFSVSLTMKASKSAEEPANIALPRSERRACTWGSARIALISLLSLSTIAPGVLLRRPMVHHWLRLVARHKISRWWKIGQCFKAHCGCHRQSAKSAGPDMLNRWRQTDEHYLYLSAKQIGHRRRRAAIRHMRHVNPRHRPKEFASHMVDTTGARRPQRDLAGVRFGVSNELRNGFDGKGWVHRHDKGAAAHANQGHIADEVE